MVDDELLVEGMLELDKVVVSTELVELDELDMMLDELLEEAELDV